MAAKYVSKIKTPYGKRLVKAVALADDIWTTLRNTFKPKQTAVPSPSASGSGVQFIDQITQDENGVITPHKRVITDASQSSKGLMSAEDKTKLDNITSPYQPKGSASVVTLNGTISGLSVGWLYTLLDNGILTAGNIQVVAGDEVAWDGSAWYKVGNDQIAFVSCYYDNNTSSWVMDKTYLQILGEYNSGRAIVLKWAAGTNDDRTLSLERKATISSKNTFVFMDVLLLTDSNSNIYPDFYIVSINEDNVVSVNNKSVSYDVTLNGTSANAVENNVIYNALKLKENKLATVDGKTELDIVGGVFSVANGNTETRLQLTTLAALQINANSGTPNFAITIDNSLNANNVTLSVKDSTGTNDLLYSVASGNEITAGKIYQLTCVGSCWTLAEFTAPTP